LDFATHGGNKHPVNEKPKLNSSSLQESESHVVNHSKLDRLKEKSGGNLIDKHQPDMSKNWNKLTDYQRRILLRQAGLPEHYAIVSFGNMAMHDDVKEKIRVQSVKNDEKIKELKKDVKKLQDERKSIMVKDGKGVRGIHGEKLNRLDEINHKLPYIYTHIENLGGHV